MNKPGITLISIASLVFFLLALQSCTIEVPYNPGDVASSQPVVHMYFCPDSPLLLKYSKTTSILATEEFVNDEKIKLNFNSGTTIDSMYTISNGKYITTVPAPLWNQNYEITGTFLKSGFKVGGTVPNKLAQLNIDTFESIQPGVGRALTCEYRFVDSAAYKNYYRIYAKVEFWSYTVNKENQRIDSAIRNEFLEIKSNHISYLNNNFNQYTSKEILIEDNFFNGVDAKFSIYLSNKYRNSPKQRIVFMDFYLENIEKGLYNYFNTRNAHLWQQSSITQIPGNIEGNIYNGFGVIGAYSIIKKRVYFR